MRVAVERFSEIFDSLDYHVALYDREWRYVYVNREAARLLGRDASDLLGRSIWELFPEAVGNQYYRELHDAAGTGRPIHSDHFYQPFARWFENHIYPVTDGVLVLSRDVTAERLAAAAQQQRDTMLRLAQRAGGVGTYEWDLERGVAHCSAELFSLFGLPPMDGPITQAEWLRHVHPDDTEALAAHLTRALAGDEPAVLDYRIITAQGQTRWLTYAGQFVRTAGGARRMLGTVVDVTARKEAEARLQQADAHLREQAQKLAEANRLKDEFLATLSHELRTPLNVIRGRTSMLLMAGDLQTAHANAEVIERNAVTLEMLVADLLDVSRITLGQMRIEPQRISLAAVVASALQGIQAAAEARGLEVRVDVPADLPPLRADLTRMQQVIWNLLNNAVKFTPDGGQIEVQGSLDGDRLQLVVRDTGQGIDAAKLSHVFDMFWQAEPASSRTHGGLGLGLSIAQRLVELHGGTITAHSDGPGRGTAFVVRLPVAPAAVLEG
jgi:PAS domain S-box-containing protein